MAHPLPEALLLVACGTIADCEDYEGIAGHGRLAAAKLLGLKRVPTVRLSHLSAAQRRAYVIADNAVALKSGWDREIIAVCRTLGHRLNMDLSPVVLASS